MKYAMARSNLVLISVSLVLLQFVSVSFADEYSDNIDWTTLPEEFKKLGAGIRKKCLAETGAVENVIDAVEEGEFPDDQKLACYFKCLMEKGGVLKNNKINFKLISVMIPSVFRKMGQDILDECRGTTGKDPCELAYNFNKCLFNANPVAFFVV